MPDDGDSIHYDATAAAELAAWSDELLTHAADRFEAARQIATRLGAQAKGDG
ncbi:MAG: hypothetical protein HKM96_05250, partial [Boseongicola sp.]|nr:hypothetical protein [Boseongicola sp.]